MRGASPLFDSPLIIFRFKGEGGRVLGRGAKPLLDAPCLCFFIDNELCLFDLILG